MTTGRRQSQILQRLAQEGELGIPELSAAFSVSEMTIRRDLNQLAASGLLTRTHGGASRVQSGSFEPQFEQRMHTNAEVKARIAAVVARQLEDGQTVILDGGSTGLAVARALAGRRLTVYALNLRVAEVLAGHVATRVLVPGGQLRTHELSFVGPDAERALAGYHFDVYVMTASGVDAVAGFTEWNTDDAAVKRAALSRARRTIAACDASKFGQVAFAQVCALDDIDTLVSDQALDERGHEVKAAGPQVLIA